MKTIGTLLRIAREQQGLSQKELSRATKIKPEFIDDIENENWNKLPELPVVSGFVKSIADALSINRDQAVAFLRRDYPPQKLSINPKPDIKKEVRFGPRAIIFILGLLGALVMGGYLTYQYRNFTSAPKLTVISPVENELVTSGTVMVRGTTDMNAAIRINETPVVVDSDGNFAAEIQIVSETKAIVVKAISRTGKESILSRTIDVKLSKK